MYSSRQWGSWIHFGKEWERYVRQKQREEREREGKWLTAELSLKSSLCVLKAENPALPLSIWKSHQQHK